MVNDATFSIIQLGEDEGWPTTSSYCFAPTIFAAHFLATLQLCFLPRSISVDLECSGANPLRRIIDFEHQNAGNLIAI